MKIISWNCRGLENPSTSRAFLRLAHLENPNVVFLMETRLKTIEVEGFILKCNFNNGFGEDCNVQGKDRARGLALMWRDTIDISIISYSLNHVGGNFVDEFSGGIVAFVGFYGHLEDHKKKDFLGSC
ncbi:unnamed protein product [Lathyrus sativus]|nr:unnamed protein product [Lathyrus sativus]